MDYMKSESLVPCCTFWVVLNPNVAVKCLSLLRISYTTPRDISGDLPGGLQYFSTPFSGILGTAK
jgi:hypothetical protein